MGIKKVSFYELKVDPSTPEEVGNVSIPITFELEIERWAFSVALTHLGSRPPAWNEGWIGNASAYVSLFSERGVFERLTHGTWEEYGKLISLDFQVEALLGIEVIGLLTLYEYEVEYERLGGRAVEVEIPKAF